MDFFHIKMVQIQWIIISYCITLSYLNAVGNTLLYEHHYRDHDGVSMHHDASSTLNNLYSNHQHLSPSEFQPFLDELFSKAKNLNHPESIQLLKQYFSIDFDYFGQFRYSFQPWLFSLGKVPSGYGILCYPNTLDIQYKGEFINGRFYGKGTLYHPNGHKVYEGEFIYNQKEGQGIEFYPNGQIKYKGTFKNGVYDGHGELFEDGYLKFKGHFHNGNAEGTFYFRNGKIRYQGATLNGKFHGRGILNYIDGNMRYRGEFKDGKYDGWGSYFYKSGKLRLMGEFKQDVPHGQCTELYENGNIKYKGEYSLGLYDGQGNLYDENGKLEFTGIFEKGEKVHGKVHNANGEENWFGTTDSYEQEVIRYSSLISEQDSLVDQIIKMNEIQDVFILNDMYKVVLAKKNAFDNPELDESENQIQKYCALLTRYGFKEEADKTLEEFKEKKVVHCIICYQELDVRGDILPCQHEFHKECIQRWFKTLQDGNQLKSCPICRSLY